MQQNIISLNLLHRTWDNTGRFWSCYKENGFKKKESYFEYSAWAGGVAILVMLLKINFEIKSLAIAIPGTLRTLKFIPMVMVVMGVYIVASWVYIIYKVVTKKANA